MTQQASRAWSWRHAFAASDVPATTKAVLHTVGMFMNEMGESCYPSVADICRYSGLDKKTVLKHLALASEAGWLAISQHGFRGQKWKRNQYAPRWPDRDLLSPCPPCGDDEGGGARPPRSHVDKAVDSAPEGGGTEGSKVVEHVHQDKTSPENIPETSPTEREGARERGQGGQPETPREPPDETPGRASFEKRVQRLLNGRGYHAGQWPNWDSGRNATLSWIVGQFAKLSPEQRAEVERWRDAYLLDIADRKQTPKPFGVFVQDRIWEGLDPAIIDRAAQKRAQPAADEPIVAKPFGKPYMAKRFAMLLAGPSFTAFRLTPFEAMMVRDGKADQADLLRAKQASSGFPGVLAMDQSRGASAPEHIAALGEPFTQARRGDDRFQAWTALHAARGWPWIPDWVEWVWLPPGEPDEAIAAFEAALRARDSEMREAAE